MTPSEPAMPSADVVERVCRAYCEMDNVDPDQTAWGGAPLWQVYRPRTLRALAATAFLLAERDAELSEVIDEREALQAAMSGAYCIVTGDIPGWSNQFGLNDAVDAIRDETEGREAELTRLRSALAERDAEIARKDEDIAYGKKILLEQHDIEVLVGADGTYESPEDGWFCFH